jgi:hypothetical protein
VAAENIEIPSLSAATATPQRDYPFRPFAPCEAFAQGMAKLALAIDYTNFKSTVAARTGWPREAIYAEVWSVVRKLEQLPDEQLSSRKRSPSSNSPRRPR